MTENHRMGSNPRFTRREMLEVSSSAALAGIAAGSVAQAAEKRPRLAFLTTFWGAPGSHADWIIDKLMDGYWWKGAHTPSRVDIASVYINQFETSGLGQKVCKAKNVPIFKTVGEAVTLGGKELAVDGVVIVGEHGNYPTNLKGQWLLPRWWMYQQVIRVFEQSKRSVPVFNDKHFSTSWDEAKWMFDKSRELNFPLTGGSSIPSYFRKPEIELDIDTPIKASIVAGDAADEGALFHCVDVLQSFVERRKGGETGVERFRGIDFGDDDFRSGATGAAGQPASAPAVAGDHELRSGQQEICGADDAVDGGLSGAVTVVKKMLGVGVVDGDDGELQHPFLRHRAQADDAGRGLFGSADHAFERVGALGVQDGHQVGAVVHGDVRLVVDGGEDVVVVSVVVLALDGVDGNVVVADQAGGNIVLRRQRVRGAEHDFSSAIAQADAPDSRSRP